MAERLESLEDLKDWSKYRLYMRKALGQVGPQPELCFISRERFDFEIKGSKWKGFAVVVGKRARSMVKAFRQGGLPFLEGEISSDGKLMTLHGFKPAQIKGADKAFTKLKLPYQLDLQGASAEEDADDEAATQEGPSASEARDWSRRKAQVLPQLQEAIQAGGELADRLKALLKKLVAAENDGKLDEANQILDRVEPVLQRVARQGGGSESDSDGDGDLPGKARTLEQAVQVWQRTEEAARNEVRKLQRAVLQADQDRGRGIARGLETILDNLDSIEDEARAAARAAADRAQDQFDRARDVLVRKMERMRREVESNELIRDAEDNPLVQVRIRETISRSLDQLMRAV